MAVGKRTSSKKKVSKLKKLGRIFNPRSLKGGMALFALVFAVSGAGYYAYRSFAAGGAGSWGHTCVTGKDTYLYCWGYNTQGQLGVGDKLGRSNWLDGKTSLTNIAKVSLGRLHTCAVKTNGNLYCWGYNTQGQLGIGNYTDYTTPRLVTTGVKDIATGDFHTCAVKTDNNLYCWGSNQTGEAGVGSSADYINTPLYVAGGFKSVAAGYAHTCAVKTDNNLYCWGFNSSGQLGIGNKTNQYRPSLTGIHTAISVTAGGYHTCTVTTALNLWCWGSNGSGQLGIGNNTTQTRPKEVTIYHGVAAVVSAGYAHTCAISTASNLRCWGSNGSGQLGIGSTTDKNTPQLMASSVSGVMSGGQHTCMAKGNGTVYCWGDNGFGQLGIASYTDKFSPSLLPLFLWK